MSAEVLGWVLCVSWYDCVCEVSHKTYRTSLKLLNASRGVFQFCAEIGKSWSLIPYERKAQENRAELVGYALHKVDDFCLRASCKR